MLYNLIFLAQTCWPRSSSPTASRECWAACATAYRQTRLQRRPRKFQPPFLLRVRSSGAKSKLQPMLRSSGARVDRFSAHEVQVPGPRPQTRFPSATSCSPVPESNSNAQSSVFGCPEGW